jgi:uncharacterized DUF497 family protein
MLAGMVYVWDPEKDRLNRQKHGISLADGVPALNDANKYYWFDDRFDYGEERIVTLGRNQMQVLYVVTTVPDKDEARIISVRKAEKDEVKEYYLQMGTR